MLLHFVTLCFIANVNSNNESVKLKKTVNVTVHRCVLLLIYYTYVALKLNDIISRVKSKT
jgi:hypothetical protein